MNYIEIRERVNSDFEGYIPNFDMAICDILLTNQSDKNYKGDILELEVFRYKACLKCNFKIIV